MGDWAWTLERMKKRPAGEAISASRKTTLVTRSVPKIPGSRAANCSAALRSTVFGTLPAADEMDHGVDSSMPVQKVVSKGLYGIEVEQVHSPSLGRPASRDHGLCGGFGKGLVLVDQDYVRPAGQSQRNAASAHAGSQHDGYRC